MTRAFANETTVTTFKVYVKGKGVVWSREIDFGTPVEKIYEARREMEIELAKWNKEEK